MYLGILATSIPSERVFSTAGDIVTAQQPLRDSESVTHNFDIEMLCYKLLLVKKMFEIYPVTNGLHLFI